MGARDLTGKLVVITGAGRGIGRATAEQLLRKGARLALADVDFEVCESTSKALATSGAEVRPYALDVRDRAAFEEVIARIEHEQGSIDVLINNAGIMSIGPFLEQGDQADRRQTEINLFGVIHGMRAVLPRMKARGRGHVINVSSMAGKLGVPYIATYSATKHAVVGLTEAVMQELKGSGIDFSYVMPIPVNTELMAGARRMIWPPMVEPEDVAGAIVRCIERPKVEVFVPGYQRLIAIFPHLVPRALSEWIARSTGFDRVFKRFDEAQRAAYVARTTGREETQAPKVRVVH